MILVYSHTITPRIKYAFELLCKTLMGVDVVLTENKMQFISAFALKINYSSEILENIPKILPNGLLSKDNIEKDLDIKYKLLSPNLPVLFAHNDINDDDLGFDIASACFYLTTRYEEYNSSSNFYDYKESCAFQYDFLKLPIVHVWAKYFKEKIKKYYPTLLYNERRYKHVLTYDIDHLHAFKNKNWKVHYGRLMQEFFTNQSQYHLRKKVAEGSDTDPWMNFDYQLSLNQYVENVHYFFHCGIEKNKYDDSASMKDPDFSFTIHSIKKTNASIGLHPSYASNKNIDILKKEKKSLETISNQEVQYSRQHFLYLNFPDTYQKLLEIGITDDFTMGYSHMHGYRAGIAVPFLWFDLKENRTTSLTIHPFSVMDTCLKHHLKLSAEEGLDVLRYHISINKMYETEFCSLWHNSSLGENFGWESWRKTFEEMIKLAA